MATTTQVSNEQFLFSCIDHSNGGTVNWQNVADECGIVSKGAAAIKYKRLKDKFGSASGKSSDGGEGEEGTKTPKKKKAADKTTSAKKGSAKKRKLNDDDDREAQDSPVKAEKEESDI
ncbi:uncharacterized protein LTR77_007108 [Saxophila tyrrhenica]|uniref:Myb-like DNA-binding domain-containing protein n=1 Tax=Saxophila tyrrhenica TaxID=1690608 RepID=A0AAV9P730_9PEZI|nr:hypothetical protein LTR77_007108 [Saxophila tyrrhenica]